MKAFKKIWNVVSVVLVAVVVLCAVFLMGSRLLGYRVFTVISGSMEPTYSVGDLIYVKPVDPATVKVGDPITFVLNEELTVATHRVVRIDAENSRVYTKGDANEIEDGDPVHFKNIIGKPQFALPYLGYVSDFIQHPPGMYIAIAIGILLIIAVFLPDFIKKKPEAEDDGASKASPADYSARKSNTCKQCKYYFTDVDLPHPVCTLHEFHFEGDYTPCDKFTN